MNTYNIKLTSTNYTPYNFLPSCDVYNGGYIIDPMAAPLSFYYGTTANGGTTSVSYSGSFSVFTQELSPQSVFFKSDGTKSYVLGTISDRVYEYKLSCPWDITTSTYNNSFFSINSQETVPTGLFFRGNGLNMYLVGVDSDYIYQYNLTNAWDVSSASYSLKRFSVGTQQNQPRGLYIKSDGLIAYVIGTINSKIDQYTLGNAWDISSAAYSTKSFRVSSEEISPEGLTFKSDGTKLYVIGSTGNFLQYSLTTPWDVSTAIYDGSFLNVSDKDQSMRDLYFRDNGNSLYFVGNTNSKLYQYYIYNSWILSGVNNFSLTANGGDFDVKYNDLKNMTQIADGVNIFCNSEVIFDLSQFDQTRSKIIKVTFDADNGSEYQTFTTYISNNFLLYPVLSSIKANYTPSESFYTYFNPTFIIDYDDGNSVNILVPLTSIQCGIYDTYKNKKILESIPYYNNIYNSLIFMNDINDNSLFISDIYTRLPFILSANLPEQDVELPNIIKPVPFGSRIATTIDPVVPKPPAEKNPVRPPSPFYTYSEYDGISIFINNTDFNVGDEFSTDNSLTIITGGSPYFAGTGISIGVITDLNN